MGLFRPNLDRPGPGIPKNAPPSRGFRLFAEILSREPTGLVILNLCFCCCALPLFVLLFFQGNMPGPLWAALVLAAALPVGPAAAALSRTTCLMVRDKPVSCFRDFWGAFRENFRQGALLGLPSVLCAGVLANLLLYALASGTASPLSLALLLAGGFLLHAVGLYLFPLAANVQLSTGTVLANAALLALAGGGRTLAAGCLAGGLHLAALLFFPYSVPVLLLFHFSLCTLISSLWVWPVIQTYAVRPSGAPEPPGDAKH